MSKTCLHKQEQLKNLFLACPSEEARYEKIIEMGKNLPPLADSYKTEENLVKGCQSQMYLRSFTKNGALFFEADSEALISKGLAALLIAIYSGENAETILKTPPHVLSEVGLNSSLTPSRSNGLYSLYLKMKQEALKAIAAINCTDLQI